MANDSRFRYLDSLRGIAALIVVSAHYLASFLPYAVFGKDNGYPRHYSFEEVFFYLPFSLLSAGHFAVSLFFILSGFILSYRFLGHPAKWREVIGAAIKRPLRLAGLIIVSVLIGASLWRFGLLANREAADITGSVRWLGEFWQGAFKDSDFIQRFFRLTAGSEYNPPLWTIRIELVGSLLVFALLPLLNIIRFRWRLLMEIAVILLMHGSFYQGFVIGIVIADLHKHYHASARLKQIRSLPGFRFLEYLMVVPAVFLAAFPYYASEKMLLRSVYSGLPDIEFLAANYAMLGAMLVFLVFTLSPRLQALLNFRWLHWLGNISYAIYVLHFLVLGSLVCRLFLFWLPALGYLPAAASASVVGLVVLVPFAVAATRYVDTPSMALADKLEKVIVRQLRIMLPPSRRGALPAEYGK